MPGKLVFGSAGAESPQGERGNRNIGVNERGTFLGSALDPNPTANLVGVQSETVTGFRKVFSESTTTW